MDSSGLRDEMSPILAEAGLPPADRHVRFVQFTGAEFVPGSLPWVEAFGSEQRQFLASPDFSPDLVLGAVNSTFVIALRSDVARPERVRLVRHAAAHIALGHVRFDDTYLHGDNLADLANGGPRRRWDREAEDLLDRFAVHAAPEDFQVAGLAEAYARLISGDVDPPELSAQALLEAFRAELVEVPRALSEHADLFPHQRRGIAELVARLRRFNVAILADSVGLGKTRAQHAHSCAH